MKKRDILAVRLLCIIFSAILLAGCGANHPKETDDITYGIDVAKYQGTIDWEEAALSGVEFAMVRVGYRANADGEIVADSNARYNMQEAQKYGIQLGAYFFSTAVSEAEAIEEANWVADYISQYAITYPVAYDCEGYQDPDSRQYTMGKFLRTDVALAFLETIEDRDYQGMFYASKNEMEENAQWEMDRIEKDYKIWVAQYPEYADPGVDVSSYSGDHQMWQYSADGLIPGISQGVDMNVAYFGYEETAKPQSEEAPEEVGPDVEALMDFREVSENVTAKEETNLRDIPSQDTDSTILYTLKNGEVATRIAVSDSGWSKVIFDGNTYYAVSSYLTTDLDYTAPVEVVDDGVKTVFIAVNEQVTAKELVNLRTLPSVEHEDSEVVVQLKHGEVITRTGINTDLGWSRVEYNGQILYCVSSLLMLAE